MPNKMIPISSKQHRFARIVHCTKMPFGVEIKSSLTGEYIVVLGGVKKILQYGSEEMKFKCYGCIFVVEGSGLLCKSFQNGYVEIVGKVAALHIR